jgi:hypothetical protein
MKQQRKPRTKWTCVPAYELALRRVPDRSSTERVDRRGDRADARAIRCCRRVKVGGRGGKESDNGEMGRIGDWKGGYAGRLGQDHCRFRNTVAGAENDEGLIKRDRQVGLRIGR